MEKRKVGLCLAFSGTNYGMLLQAYATQRVIEKLGYDTEIIHYISKGYSGVKFDWGLFFELPRILIKRLRKKNKQLELDDIHKKNIEDRKSVADRFRSERMRNIKTVIGADKLFKAGKEFDAVLVGSDQVWLPGALFGLYYSLNFVPDNTPKISYATSLGVSTYPWHCKGSASKVWKRIEHLSVREEQGKKIIQSICGNIPVEVVVDPTYLLSKEEWENLIPVEIYDNERYVLCFFLGNSVPQQLCARAFADSHHLKLVSILSNESVSDIDISYADRIITGASPEEFINWIRGAEFIFTDSFHGTAFSIINQKQFFVFYRKRDVASGSNSRNSRIDNILNKWEIKDRLIIDPNINWDKVELTNIKYIKVGNLVMEARQHSMEFLTNALL